MKNLFVGLALLLSVNVIAQDKAEEWHTNLVNAVDISVKESKPLFLFFTGSDWCGWCKRLQKEVFIQPQFQKWADKNVILVELDFPRRTPLDPTLQQQNYEIAQMFGIRGYPTVWLVTASRDGSQISFNKLGSTGYVAGGPDAWLDVANQILSSQK